MTSVALDPPNYDRQGDSHHGCIDCDLKVILRASLTYVVLSVLVCHQAEAPLGVFDAIGRPIGERTGF